MLGRLLADILLSPLSWVLSRILSGVGAKDRTLLVCGGRQFGGNTAPVFKQARAHGLRAVWLTTRPEILKSGLASSLASDSAQDSPQIVNARSLRGVWIAARAGGVCLTHSLGDFAPCHFAGTRIFNLWHGMPIKRISTQDPGFWDRSYAKSNVREMKRYDAMFATSPAMAELFAKTFLRPVESVYVTGQPRNDALLAPPPDLEARFEPELPPHIFKILHCPTWREGESVRLFPFPDHDVERLQKWLADNDAVMCVRTHPNDPGRLEKRDRRLIPMQGDILPEVTNGLACFDVLVTDYSSVYYDYLMLDRPTVFLPYDLAAYSEKPGFYIPFEDIIAGPCPDTLDAFLAALNEALEGAPAYSEARARVRALVYTDVDRGSTERTLGVVSGTLKDSGAGQA